MVSLLSQSPGERTLLICRILLSYLVTNYCVTLNAKTKNTFSVKLTTNVENVNYMFKLKIYFQILQCLLKKILLIKFIIRTVNEVINYLFQL